MSEAAGETSAGAPRRSRALLVATGILASRVAGFVRDRAIAHFFGVGPHADVFRLALRGPNVLQNLLGEGTISAAFIPVYTRLVEEGRREDAGRFAGAIFGLLVVATSLLALLGVLLARPLVALLAPGFAAEDASVAGVDRFELAVATVRVVFPMVALLVLSAWALGILNSHRRFLLPYTAPVLWNAAIIAALFAAAEGLLGAGFFAAIGRLVGLELVEGRDALLVAACVGALAGALFQLLVQLPAVLRVTRGLVPSLALRAEGVREALARTGPAIAGRGVYQLSGWLDLFLASWLATGALAALGWAQALYLLPISLFGMSVAASELPELARRQARARAAQGGSAQERGDAPGLPAALERAEQEALRAPREGGTPRGGEDFDERVRASLSQIALLVAPTALGYVALGPLLVAAVYQTGRFGAADAWLVGLVLGAYALGLVPTTWSRLMQNAFFALGDTKTPARVAALRVASSTLVGVPLMLLFDRFALVALLPHLVDAPGAAGLRLGAAGLALGSAAGAFVELIALARALRRRRPGLRLPGAGLARAFSFALAGLPGALACWWWFSGWPPIPLALVVLAAYGLVVLVLAGLFARSDLRAWWPGGRRR